MGFTWLTDVGCQLVIYICHKPFGSRTEYFLLRIVSNHLILTPSGSTRQTDSLKVRLHTAINIGPISYLGACYIVYSIYTYTKVTKCIREKMMLYTFIDKPLNHIHQDTKSARLIAVCKRSLTLHSVIILPPQFTKDSGIVVAVWKASWKIRNVFAQFFIRHFRICWLGAYYSPRRLANLILIIFEKTFSVVFFPCI